MTADVPVAQSVEELSAEYKHLIIHDRGQAIRTAVTCAGANGVVLVAGKGHETEQIIGDERRPWSDITALQELAASQREQI